MIARFTVLATLASLSATTSADPTLQIGGRQFITGAAVTTIAVCSDTRALSVEWYGPSVYDWTLPTGDLRGVIGPRDKEQLFLACAGDRVLTGNFDDTHLYEGAKEIAHAAIKNALGGALVAGKALVVDADGVVYELTAAGATRSWVGEAVGLKALVRAALVVSWDGPLLRWSTPKGTTKVTFPTDIADAVDLGDAFAVVDKAGAVRVLTAPSLPAQPLATIDPDKLGAIYSIGGDRAWIAVGTYDSQLVQVSRKTGKTLAPLELIPPRMSRDIKAIAVADGRWLVGTSDNRIYSVPQGATSFQRPAIDGHDDIVWAVAFDDKLVVSGASDDTVQVHTRDGKLVQRLTTSDERPFLRVGLTAELVWARDDYDNLRRWRRKDWKALPVIEGISDAVALDGRKLAVVSRGHLGTLDLASGKVSTTSTKRSDVRITAAGGLVATVDDVNENAIEIFELASGKRIARLELPDLSAFAFTSDGARLAIAADSKLHMWTRKTGKLTDAGEHSAPISALAFAPDGRLASGDWRGTIRIWKPGSTKPASELSAHLGHVYGLYWRANTLASSAADYQVKLWDVAP